MLNSIPGKELYQAIEARESRRKFKSRPLPQEQIDMLKARGDKIEEICPAVKIEIKSEGFERVSKNIFGLYGLISGAWSYGVVIADTSCNNYQEQAGYGGEILVLSAEAAGIDSCWIGGFYDREALMKEVDIREGQEIMAIIALGQAKAKTTISEKVVKLVSGSKKRKELDELCLPEFKEEWPEWIKTAVKAARLAPSAVNRQPWRFKVEDDTLILLAAAEEDKGSVSPLLDCGIALAHLELGAAWIEDEIKVEFLETPEVASLTRAQG
ncbi:MAG: nitroreductase family protein [Bacillota bacterium]